MSGEHGASPVHRLFGPDTVILAEPRHPVLRRRTGPKMHMVAEDGTVLAHVHERGPFAYVLHDLDERPVLGVDLVSGRGGFARPGFLVTDPEGDPIGDIRSPGRLLLRWSAGPRRVRIPVSTASGAATTVHAARSPAASARRR
ncbi:hypothetical protein [Streptomyces sp. NPDC055055]